MKPAFFSLLAALLCASAFSQKVNSKRVNNAILGAGVGASLADAHAKLDSLGTGGGRDTSEGGRKEAWTFKTMPFASLALKTNKRGTVVWFSGFIRSGQEIPFNELGDLKQASVSNKSQTIWNVKTPDGGVS